MSETYDLSPEALERAEALLLEPEDLGAAASIGTRLYRDALTCLRESQVRFCLLRDGLESLHDVADLDVLIDVRDRRLAFAALERAGFLHRRDRRLGPKWVFVRCESGRFYTLDVHGACVQAGIEYMSAKLALDADAEVLLDALAQVMEVPVKFAGQPLGTRAVQLPGVQPRQRGAPLRPPRPLYTVTPRPS